MDKSKFEKGKELESRIFQLEVLKKYLESFLNGEQFSLKIEMSLLGQGVTTPFKNINGNFQKLQNYDSYKEDNDFIIQHLQSRIDLLETEFESL